MSKNVTSARGEKVDFDLLRIKNAMNLPITENVRKRERFVNKKRRRGLKNHVDEMIKSQNNEESNFVPPDTSSNPQDQNDDSAIKQRRKVK